MPRRRPPSPPLGCERFEARQPLAADHMRVGMNLENVVDWSPAWTFTDAFQASRSWIAQAIDTSTGGLVWDVGDRHPLTVGADGEITHLATWQEGGRTFRQTAATLMFRDCGGSHPAGTYRAEWDGTGEVVFGFDARVVATGTTAAGHHYADLEVAPSESGILVQIRETLPVDPIRDLHVWMPDWNGQRFAGQRWTPGASFSPFHPLYLERLAPFDVIRFMALQETNSTDIVTWDDRRDADAARQGSGSGGSPSEPLVNGMAVEYMVQLANDLDADPWFNMPFMADDDFVRRFATYVRDHLEPGRTAYVEWANEVWNFGWGFEAAGWVEARTALPEYAGLDTWQVAGREAGRDMAIWSEVFAATPDRLVRVAAGWAAVDWVTNRIVEAMDGAFDAIAIAPYITPTDAQRAGYSAATTVDRVLADTRTNLATALEWTSSHERLARDWSSRLGRPIELVAYEGGAHLDGRNAPYQQAFYAATNDPRMEAIYRDYLRGLDAAGMDLYVDFQFTGQPGAAAWGDFAKLHRMDEPLATAWRYAAVAAAADGSLWSVPPEPELSIASATATEGHVGRRWMTFVVTLSAPAAETVSVAWSTAGGTAVSGRDFVRAAGRISFAPGQTRATLRVQVIGDRVREADEQFTVRLGAATGARLAADGGVATGTILDDDRLRRLTIAMFAALGDREP